MPEHLTSTAFDRYPALWLSVAYAVGILSAEHLVLNFGLLVGIAALFGTASLLLRSGRIAALLMLAAFASAGTLTAFVERNAVSPDRVRELYDSGKIKSGDPVDIEGVLAGPPETAEGGSFMVLRVDSIRTSDETLTATGRVRIFLQRTSASSVSDDDADIPPRLIDVSRIRVECRLRREDEFLDPGVLPVRESLDRAGIDATCSLKSSRSIEHIADEPVFLPLSWIYRQRAALIDDLNRGLNPQAAGVMIASLLGNKHFLDRSTADLFREGGTFHILVISGLHVTFIGGFLLLLIRQLTGNRRIQFVVVAGLLWIYTVAVGANTPVARASIMFTILLSGYAFYLRGTMLNSLGLCALLLLTLQPSSLTDPSFQLTFVSIGAIVSLAYPILDLVKKIGSWTPNASSPFPPRVPTWLKRFSETLYWDEDAWAVRSRRFEWSAGLIKSPHFSKPIRNVFSAAFRFLFEALSVSFIVQITMLPLSVVYFHRISMASVILNIWVSFFIAIESFAAISGVMLSHLFSPLAAPFFRIADLANSVMLSLPKVLSGMNWASFRPPAYLWPTSAVYSLYFVPLIVLVVAFNHWRPFELVSGSRFLRRAFILPAAGVLISLASIIAFHPYSASPADGRLYIDFLDVGQGDSALITFPNGQTMLIDGGGRPKYRDPASASAEGAEPFEPDTRGIGEAVVSEVLWNKGLSHIDYIVATHADADHIQGLNDVAKNFSIGAALVGRTPSGNAEYTAFAETLRRRGIPVTVVAQGDVLNIGVTEVRVLYPTHLDDPDAVSNNDSSVVLRIVYGDRIFLLTGDIEHFGESAMITEGEPLKADVVKVPHHGSRTSSTAAFVDAVLPELAIVSVGRNSPFGHPNADVVNRWLADGAEIMTTGERGMVSVSTDGSDLSIRRFIQDSK